MTSAPVAPVPGGENGKISARDGWTTRYCAVLPKTKH